MAESPVSERCPVCGRSGSHIVGGVCTACDQGGIHPGQSQAAEVERLRKALAFYADEDAYGWHSAVHRDGGRTARGALIDA